MRLARSSEIPASHDEAGSPSPLTKTMRCSVLLASLPGKKVHEIGASGLDGIVKKVGDAMLTDEGDLSQTRGTWCLRSLRSKAAYQNFR